LEGFLLTPIQRLCKYPLLLKEMLKHTPEDSPRHPVVVQAMEAAKEAASTVNDIQRVKENKKIFNELQSRIEGWEGADISENNIELLLESVVSKISHGKSQDRQFFLFDKLLLYCKENPLKKKSYQFKGRIALDKMIATDLPDGHASASKQANGTCSLFPTLSLSSLSSFSAHRSHPTSPFSSNPT
jgi:hypothetical protein